MAGSIKWLDEDPEMMKEIPPEEERVACVWGLRVNDTPFRVLLMFSTVVLAFLFFGGRHGPFLDWGIKWRIGTLVWFIFALLFVFFLARHEKAHVDIYPNMFVWYDYDQYSKKARPSQFYYWSDVVQYNAAEPYIWLGNKSLLLDISANLPKSTHGRTHGIRCTCTRGPGLPNRRN